MARAVRVEGLANIDKALGELKKSTGKNVLRRVARERLEPVAEAMRDRVPERLGDLKESIVVTTKRPRRHRPQSTIEAFAGPGRHPQAHLQEFGTRHHGPQPYARPAWDQEKDAMLDGIGQDLWSEIERAAQRAARKAARQAGG